MNRKIAVAGTGYVGLSLAVLLAQHNNVIAVDVIPEKVDKINNKKSPIQDDYIEKYLAEKELNPSYDLELIGKAYDLAGKMHQGQLRKSGEPYIIHPVAVAKILAELGMDEQVIAAGLLHDVVEDTDYTTEQLKEDFGVSAISRFPDVLFESCSGGGGRFDAGMMYYMPQAWVSDNTDAVCRLKIQTGTSLVFPPATMGCHVSVVPNHQVGRITPLNFRGLVAMCGAFGYEMDICRMSDEDKAEVKEQIKLFKDIRPMVQQGEFTRLKSPFDGNDTAWSFTSKDGSRMAVMYFRILSQMAPEVGYLKLQGLEPNALYRISTFKMPEHAHEVNESYLKSNDIEGKEFYGDELMNFGLTITPALLDFAAYMWIIEKIG